MRWLTRQFVHRTRFRCCFMFIYFFFSFRFSFVSLILSPTILFFYFSRKKMSRKHSKHCWCAQTWCVAKEKMITFPNMDKSNWFMNFKWNEYENVIFDRCSERRRCPIAGNKGNSDKTKCRRRRYESRVRFDLFLRECMVRVCACVCMWESGSETELTVLTPISVS